MIVYLSAAGVDDAGRTFGRHLREDIHQIIVPENTSPSRISHIVTQSFREREGGAPAGSINLLVINSHGSPGRIHLGGVTNSETDIDIHNESDLTSVFRPLLKPRDQGGEGVEIHACQIASGSLLRGSDGILTDEVEDAEIGFRFIYALARGFNIRVRTSSSPQVTDYEGYFEDTLIEAEPDDDEDWHEHITSNNYPGLLHEGGNLTRLGAIFLPPPMTHDPRTGRRREIPDPRRDTTRRPLW